MDPIAQLSVRLHLKRSRLGNEALSPAERIVVDVMGVAAEVMNGGFHQFFFNRAGDRAAESVAALREIRARAAASIVAQACSRFPDGAPNSDRFTRQQQLETLALETFRDLDMRFRRQVDEVVKLLERAVQRP
jgi:hypothetical protein